MDFISVFWYNALIIPKGALSMGRKATTITLSDDDRSYLESLTRTRTIQAQTVSRARILLLKANGTRIDEIANKVDMNRKSVMLCINKYLDGGIENALFDAPGRGRNAEITDDEKAWIISIACQKPVDLGYSAEVWSRALLTKHINKCAEEAGHIRLSTISQSKVRTILEEADIKSNKKELDERKKGYVRSRLTGSDFMAGVKRIETSAKNPDGSIIHVDCYTGEPLVAGRVEDKYDHEHVISAKELSESYFTGLFLSEEEIRAFANSDKNLKVTKAGINRSKGDEDLKKWLSKEHPGKPGVSNQEYYNIDPEIATKTYDEAHSELRRKIAMKAGERSLSVAKTTAINVGGYALKKVSK